jgi:hypothetical protein
MNMMRDSTFNKAALLARALAVVETEAYKKWLESELMRTLGYKGQSVSQGNQKKPDWS